MNTLEPEHHGRSDLAWLLRLPFIFSGGKRINIPEAGYQSTICGWNCALGEEDGRYVLTIQGLPSEDVAMRFLRRLGGGLMWARSVVKVGIKFELELDRVHYPKDSVAAARNIFGADTSRRVEAIIDGQRTVIFPQWKEVAKISAGTVSAYVAWPADKFIAAVHDGACLENAACLVENEKLRLASEILSHSYFESSQRARFLAQMTALEVLAERPEQPSEICAMIERWMEEVSRKKAEVSDTGQAVFVNCLIRLKSSLRDLRKESITESVRLLVSKALTSLEGDGAEALVAKVGKLYRIRSDIAHGRSFEIGEGSAELEKIVTKTLSAVMTDPSLIETRWQS